MEHVVHKSYSIVVSMFAKMISEGYLHRFCMKNGVLCVSSRELLYEDNRFCVFGQPRDGVRTEEIVKTHRCAK